MQPIGIGASDIGRKRDQNEDALVVDNELGLYIVCDGMGGHAGGEVAARTAIDVVQRHVGERRALLERARQGTEDPSSVVALAEQAVQQACREIHRLATTRPGQAGMGSTLTMLLLGGDKAVMAHVGDTRLYLRRELTVSQLSSDHTVTAELVRSGAISPEEARAHPYRHVLTRALGTQASVIVETLVFDVVPGDRLLLCSDGLSDYVDDHTDLSSKLGGELDGCAEELVAWANAAGGRDNISAVVVDVEADEPTSELALSLGQEVQVKLESLGTLFLFEGLGLAQMQRVLNSCALRSYRKGQEIVREGEQGASLLVVVEGRVALTRSGELLAELGTGDAVGQTMLFEERPSRATLVAQTPARLLVLSRGRFGELVRRRPWLGLTLLERLGRWASDALERRGEQSGDLAGQGLPGDLF